MLDSLEEPEPEPLAELPELDDSLAACSRWHCSSAAPVSPVHSGLEPVAPVEAASPAAPVEDDMPLDEGEALLDDEGDALSALDDPELVLGLLLEALELGVLVELLLLGLLDELLLLGLLDELSDALDPVPLELPP